MGRLPNLPINVMVIRSKKPFTKRFKPNFEYPYLRAKDVSDKPVTFAAEGKKQSKAEDAEAFLKSCAGAAYKVTQCDH